MPSSNVSYNTGNTIKMKENYINGKKQSLFIVNGKKLTPGSREYIQAEMAFEKDMMRFDKDMQEFSKSMQGFGRNMNNVSQELRDIFKVKE